MAKFEIGTKFRGIINGEEFEIIDLKVGSNGKEYYSVKHIKSGEITNPSTAFVEHLQIEVI